MNCFQIVFCIEFLINTILETALITLILDQKIQCLLSVDLIFSIFFPVHNLIYFLLQIFNLFLMIGLFCVAKYRYFGFLWLYILLKNRIRKYFIDKLEKKEEAPLLMVIKENQDENQEETRTIISV